MSLEEKRQDHHRHDSNTFEIDLYIDDHTGKVVLGDISHLRTDGKDAYQEDITSEVKGLGESEAFDRAKNIIDEIALRKL
jgi:hypothetical protein